MSARREHVPLPAPAAAGFAQMQVAMQHISHHACNLWHAAGQNIQQWSSTLQFPHLNPHFKPPALHLTLPKPSSHQADAQGQAGCSGVSLSQPQRVTGRGHAHAALASFTASASASTSLPLVEARTRGATDLSDARKAELGRATWTFLHMLAAQYPDRPTRQQKRDVKQLIECLTRVYPCASCASHFKEIVKRDPPTVSNGRELRAWTCRVHNVVNRSLGKPEFNCDVLEARWAPLDCAEDGSSAGAGAVSGCDMTIGRRR